MTYKLCERDCSLTADTLISMRFYYIHHMTRECMRYRWRQQPFASRTATFSLELMAVKCWVNSILVIYVFPFKQHDCQMYRQKYGSAPSVQHVAREVANQQHLVTLTGRGRPYGKSVTYKLSNIADMLDDSLTIPDFPRCLCHVGVHCIIAGFDRNSGSPHIYRTDCSGTMSEWTACAIGRKSDKALQALAKGLDSHSKSSAALLLSVIARYVHAHAVAPAALTFACRLLAYDEAQVQASCTKLRHRSTRPQGVAGARC